MRNNLPYRSHTKQYRIWHSPGHPHLKEVEIVEAYNGRGARQQVIDKFPGHTVGNPILWKK